VPRRVWTNEEGASPRVLEKSTNDGKTAAFRAEILISLIDQARRSYRIAASSFWR
jgi:hypothetical protein